MTVLDLILVLILFFFTASGLRFGLIHTLGALVGTVVGVLIAGNYFEEGAELIKGVLLNNVNLARVFAFIIIFVLSSRLVGLVFWIIDRAFKVVSIIPFLKSINRLAGAILGFLEGAVILGIILIFIDKFPFSEAIIPAIDGSSVAQWLLGYGKILAPLLPEAVKLLQSHTKIPVEIFGQ
jgi:membrane protein required for colicin V production